MKTITYSTKPVTLGEARLMAQVQDGNWDALLRLIVSRTDLTEAEAEGLDVADLQSVTDAIARAVNQATVLSNLGMQLGEANE